MQISKDKMPSSLSDAKSLDTTDESQKVKEKPEIKAPPAKLDVKGERRSSALSINSIHKKSEETKNNPEKEIDTSKLPKEIYTDAEFYVFWKKYIDILNKQGDKMLASILASSDPVLQENLVHLTYPNAMMLEEVKQNKRHILNYIRKKLNNHQISFRLILNEEDEKKFVYTPEEKYNKLREINPFIDDFRKAFHLDL